MTHLELPPSEKQLRLVADKLYAILEREYHNGNKPLSLTPERLMIQAIREAELA